MQNTKSTWEQVMALKSNGSKEARGVANTLSDDDLNTICATIDFFGGDYRLDVLDLKHIRYRVFDWLAMRIQGRHSGSAQDKLATKVLAYSFIKSDGIPSKFIEDLRVTDYEIDTSYNTIELED
jgi:hypothetical protein